MLPDRLLRRPNRFNGDAHLLTLRRQAMAGGFAWSATVRDRWLADADDPALVALDGLAEEAGQVAAEARHFLVRPVILPDDALKNRPSRS